MAERNKPCEQLLLRLLAASLKGASLPADEWDDAVSLAELFEESRAQSVALQVLEALPNEAKQDRDAYRIWQQWAFVNLKQTLHNLAQNSRLCRLFDDAGIPHVTIKGAASAVYYPRAELRMMGDIDLLVAPADKERALDLMERHGYRRTGHDHSFHTGLVKDNIVYELHTAVSDLPESQKQVFTYLADILPAAQTVSFDAFSVRVPTPFHHGLTLLLHTQRHLAIGQGVGLRHLFDWAAFVSALSAETFVSLFEAPLKEVGLWRFARLLSQLCHRYLGLPYAAWMEELEETLLCDWMEDMLSGGNFGFKDSEREQENLFLDRSGKQHSVVGRFFRGLCRKVYVWQPFFKRHKWLTPAGLIAYAVRTLWLMLFGGKRISTQRVLQKGQKRDRLYRDFRFFETE